MYYFPRRFVRIKHAGHTHLLPRMPKTNQFENKIPLYFRKSLNQSMNSEYEFGAVACSR